LNTKSITPINIKIETPEIITSSHDQFLKAIGFRESGNRYTIINKYGYMGRYQFGNSTLRGLGFKLTTDEFLNSPYIQEKAMHTLLQRNNKSLNKLIIEHEGKIVHGVLVTQSGILAAAHLGGAGSVKKWFRTGKVRQDGFGTKITSYMEQFGGYKLNI
jgi:hypothetical protein|tara:strand:- start:143 stop:619 length:477 start_codon:yes stop_codon:yes gene_type:complete